MYVCGVTVYDECHLGHARSALVFEVIRRYLEYRGLAVTFVKNFTDVDDKIIHRANELGIPWQAVTARYIDAYYRDMGRLGLGRATVEPKATEHMADIIELVQTLIRNGVAYQVNGDVYFQVEKFPAYGLLSKRKLDELQAGARVEIDERKRHPIDFALWKAAKPDEPAWDSPWGPGRPGWHIECSAMSMKHLGETFDIHGGGEDLIFPHHENEIAQSTGATGRPFARYWIHNGFVRVNQEKMSKSLGNFFTIREIFGQSRWPGPVTAEMLRYFLLATHYRSPIDFSDQALEEAKRTLDGFYGLLLRLREGDGPRGGTSGSLQEHLAELDRAFHTAMDDDLNTPAALAAFQRFRADVNKLLAEGLSRDDRGQVADVLQRYGGVIGLFRVRLEDWRFNPIQIAVSDSIGVGTDAHPRAWIPDEQVAALIEQRRQARNSRDFKKADRIRAELAEAGITIEDRPDGTTRWKR